MPAKKTDKRDEAFLYALGGYQKSKGVSNNELAERLGIARSTLDSWINNPSLILSSFRHIVQEAKFPDEFILKSIR